jgi:hypothetical protein
MEFTGAGKICSFCGADWSPQRRFAGGFGAQICAECIARYSDMFSTAAKLKAATRPPWNEMSNEQMLESLPDIVATSEQVDEFLHGWVGLLRERGISWQEIGLALGVSRQAAWERFTRGKRSSAREAEPG